MIISEFNAALNSGVNQSDSAASGDFETFLAMLTTQIQNQDPLSPMAAEEFASQLASFTMVEQQTLSNQKLDMLIASMSNRNLASYSALVGQIAVHSGPFNYSGSPVQIELSGVPSSSSGSVLVVLNRFGEVVSELGDVTNDERVLWDGTDSAGRLVEPELYTAEVRSVSDNSRLDVEVATAEIIEEVQFGNQGVELLLADGTVVSETSVTRLRQSSLRPDE